MKKLSLCLIKMVTFTLLISGCTFDRGELGSEKNPIKFHYVPSVDQKLIEANSVAFQAYLEKTTGYKFKMSVPHSYVAVVESFGSNQVDFAYLNTFGYILAHEKFGAEAKLTALRHGASTYQGQFVAREGGSIKTLADFAGKKIAFVDPASTSGYLLPKKVLADKGIKLKEEIFAMKHDSVISMIYQGQVDGGATFHSPSQDGEIQDARRLVRVQYPDVESKIKIIELTTAIPNDPLVSRKELPEAMKTKVIDAIMAYLQSEEGKKVFQAVYGIDAFKIASDKDYDSVREMLKTLGKKAEDIVKK